MARKSTKENKHYIDNAAFLQALIDYKKEVRKAEREKEEKPQVPDYIENCLIYMDNFDPKKSSNPFAYFTQITYYAFVRRIQKEKRHLQTKYKYIESLDIDSIIRQAHDEGEYANAFVSYLKKQADAAHQEFNDNKVEKKVTRKPKYLQKLDDEYDIGEEVLEDDETIGEVQY